MAEVPAPSARAPFRVQAGGCHLTASPSKRRAEVTISSDCAPSRFRIGASPRLVHSPSRLSRPMRRRETAEDGELESQRPPTPGRLPQAVPAPWLVHPPRLPAPPRAAPWPRGRRRNRTARERPCSEEGGLLESHGVTRASASNGARRACPVHLPRVRRAGVEPARPKTPVPGTGAATSYATSA
jgi:hypothetical protein